MMLVQVSVTAGEIGMETIATLSIQNVGEADPFVSYEWVARWHDIDGVAHAQSGVALHRAEDGALALVSTVLAEMKKEGNF